MAAQPRCPPKNASPGRGPCGEPPPQDTPVHVNVHIPKGSVRLCMHYGRGGQESCKNHDECSLHICHSYLAGSCKGQCRLSHDPIKALNHLPQQLRDQAPLNVLRNIVCPINLRDVIALSFPRLCIAYNSARGCKRKYCTLLHLCRCVAQSDKPFCDKSKLSHQIINPKIVKALRKYGLPDNNDGIQVIRKNLLCADSPKPKSECPCTPIGKTKKKKNAKQPLQKRWGSKSSLVSSQASEQCSDSSDSDNECASVQSDDDVDLYGAPPTWLPTNLSLSEAVGPKLSEQKILNNLNVPSGYGQPVRSVSTIEFREKTRSYILRQGGRVTFGMLTRDLHDQFPAGFDFEAAVKSDKDAFSSENKDGAIHQVSCLEEIRLCSLYNSDDGCPNEGICPHLHVCVDFIAGNFTPGCKKNHSVSDHNSMRVFSKLFIEVTDPKTLLNIVRNCLPQICGRYNEEGTCPSGDDCRDLHVCEDKVLRTCERKGCLNHSLTAPQCCPILKSYAMLGLKMELLRNLILPYKRSKKRQRHGSGESDRTSVPEVVEVVELPRICGKYNEEGTCPSGEDCRDLHVCEDKVLRTCVKKQACVNHSLTTPQCSKIMKSYAMLGLKSEQLRTRILPYKRSKKRQRRGSGASAQSDRSSVPEVVDTSGLVAEVRNYLLQQGGFVGMAKFTKDMTAQGHEYQMNSILQDRTFVVRKRCGKNSEIGVIIHGVRICGQYNRGLCTNADCRYLHLCKNYIADNCAPGCSFSHDLKDKNLKETWERLGIHVKIAQKILYILRNSLPQICRAYNDGGCSVGEDCRNLHICEDKFFRSCGNSSCLNHDIRVAMCQRVLAEYKFTDWDNVRLKNVILPCKKATTTKAKPGSNKTEDTPSQYTKVAPELSTTSTPEYTPTQPQATTTPSEMTQDSANLNQGGAKPKKKRRNRIRKRKDTSSEDGAKKKDDASTSEEEESELNMTSDSEPMGLSSQFSEPAVDMICEANLRRKCQADCGMLHFDLPYIWQYQLEDMWRDFSAEECESIETCFADANADKWSCDLTMMAARRNGYPFFKQTDLSFSASGAGVVIMFSMVTWAITDTGATNRRMKMSVRRLGTVSYIDARPREISTKWKWYYKDADTMWTQPEESLQDKCEETYLQYCRGEGSAFMSLGATEDDCCVDFNSMKLYTDSSGHEEIDLRRRPEAVTAMDLEARIRGRLLAPSSIPSAMTSPMPSYTPSAMTSPPPVSVQLSASFSAMSTDPSRVEMLTEARSGPAPVMQPSREPAPVTYQHQVPGPGTRPPQRPPQPACTYGATYPIGSQPRLKHPKKKEECTVQ